MKVFPPFSYAVSSVASDYAKRLADQKVWDRIMAGPVGAFLKSLSPRGQQIAEPLMYTASAVAKWHIGDSTPLRQFITEVAGDAAPELAKRMLNGHTPPPQPADTHTPDILAQGIAEFTTFIAPWHGRKKE